MWRYSRQRLMNWTAAGSEPTTPYSDTGGGWLGISAATWHREMILIKHKPVEIINVGGMMMVRDTRNVDV